MSKNLSAAAMLRSRARQVIPDTTYWRRKLAKFSSGAPVDQSTNTTLIGAHSVFDNIDIEYVFNGKAGAGYLEFSEPIWSITTTDKDGKARSSGGNSGMSRFSLFSSVSKMSCPSLSLPAGPISEGGTCAAASFKAASLKRPSRGTAPGGMRRDAKGNPFICDLCYATAGNYWYPTTTTAQTSRLVWVRRLLEADPSGAALGQALVAAIVDTATRAHYRNASKRLGHEIGVWRNGQIVAPLFIQGRRGLVETPIPPTNLPATTFGSSLNFFESKGVRNGDIVGFFRIHDSGDLNIDSSIKLWGAYLKAWMFVAKSLPHVNFWMPTRAWSNTKMIPQLVQANQIDNLVIRVSAMFVDGAVSAIDGLSTSAVHKRRLGPGHTECPVTPDDASSCAQEQCRACWVAPDLIPSYREH